MKKFFALITALLVLTACDAKAGGDEDIIVIGSFNDGSDAEEDIDITSAEKIAQTAVGADALYFMTNNGDIYRQNLSAGGGDYEYIDLPQSALYLSAGVVQVNDLSLYDIRPELKQIPFDQRISAMYTSEYFTNILTVKGEVYTLGRRRQETDSVASPFVGERYYPSETPVQIPFPETITAIACGIEHTLALGESGQVYAYGSNAVGQFGEGFERTLNYALLAVRKGGTAVFAGAYSSILAQDGALIAYGYAPASAGFTLDLEGASPVLTDSFGAYIVMQIGDVFYGVGNFGPGGFFNLKNTIRTPTKIDVKEKPVKKTETDKDKLEITFPLGGDERPVLKIANIMKCYDTFIFRGNDGYYYRYYPDKGYGEKILIFDY